MAEQESVPPQPADLPVQPSDIRDAVLAELSRLEAFVQGLSLQDWERPSAVEGWNIGEVVAHLNLALGLYRRITGVAIRGRGSGSLWKAFGQVTEKVAPVASGAFNAMNSAIPRVMDRTLSPEVIKGQFAAGARSLRERLEQAQSGDYTNPIYYMGRAWPLSFFLTAVENELAVHGWDMASRLHPEAHLSEQARTVLPWFYWGATPYMFQPPKDFVGSVQVVLRDTDAEMWWERRDRTTTTGRGRAGTPDATISAESSTFVLILAGRIKAEDATRMTALTVEGNEALARTFLGSWRIT
jgi:uncharacterized protein (TIGR03083 family)